MASSKSRTKCSLFLFFDIVFHVCIPHAQHHSPSAFNFSDPEINMSNITLQADAVWNGTVINLTNDTHSSQGRAVYSNPVLLWDNAMGEVASFHTSFSFVIHAKNTSNYGDGLAFFLSPFPSVVPIFGSGGSLGLFNGSTALNSSHNQIVAVEFDTFKNDWDRATITWVLISIPSTLWGPRTCRYYPRRWPLASQLPLATPSSLHQILYWNFNSTLQRNRNLCWFLSSRKKATMGEEEEGNMDDDDDLIDDEFERVQTEDRSKVSLVEWVWDLYGRKSVLEAADERLNGDFIEPEMESLMVVGLWCAHPDYNQRPLIQEAIGVLRFEIPLPALSAKMPELVFAPPIDLSNFQLYLIIIHWSIG
uniref:Legume lectin domain-containing protein n=1 Tax=Ananas comosus var. bracteatus TaxID=296719 RepID=A0A6V7PFN3_ANACO|nr:unnamed protein product [Ananas comosus var. bracteatus]